MRRVSHALILGIFAGTLALPGTARAADGGIYLYLQPLSTEASRLTFTVASITAITGSGQESPLRLNLTAIGAAQAGRQRLLASARLPFGSYAGFGLTVTQAAVNDAGGRAALSVPDTAVQVSAPFVVGPRPTVIWLTLRYKESIASGFSFTPVFGIGTPPQPIADHVGFVSNAGSNTLTVFDKHLAQVIAVIDTCAGPSGMALDQQRRRLYLACAKDDEVRSLDVASLELVQRARLSPGDHPRELALTPDGSTLISVNTGSNSISFYDASSLTRGERVPVGNGPASLVIDPAGRRAFVLNTFSSSISVIDTLSRAPIATLSIDSAPLRAQFSVRADKLYVIHERSPYMTVLDPSQLTIVTRVRLRIGVSALVVDTVRDLVCIGAVNDTMVEFYDGNALMPLYAARLKDGATYLAFDAAENNLYAVSSDARTLSVVRLANRKVASEIDAGDAPYAVALMGVR